MTIEFRCTSCRKLLRTADEKSGARAKCPDCGEVIIVPSSDVMPAQHSTEYEEFSEFEQDYEVPVASRPRARSKPTKTCPMCGEQVRAAATKCRHCGENLDSAPQPDRSSGGFATAVDAGEVIATSWNLYRQEMSLCIGGVVVMGLINGAITILTWFVFAMFVVVFDMAGVPPHPVIVFGTMFLVGMLSMVFHAFTQAGQHVLFFNIARGTRPEISDLFAGGPYYVSTLGNMLVFGLFVQIGFVCCFVPGIFLILMFWPYQFVIVDEEPTGLSPLSRARELTDGNWGAVFLLGLTALGFNLLGVLACGIGLLVTLPMTFLMFAVAYCRMTDQPTSVD